MTVGDLIANNADGYLILSLTADDYACRDLDTPPRFCAVCGERLNAHYGTHRSNCDRHSMPDGVSPDTVRGRAHVEALIEAEVSPQCASPAYHRYPKVCMCEGCRLDHNRYQRERYAARGRNGRDLGRTRFWETQNLEHWRFG